MGLGIAGSLIAALMITGLGDATWKYIPWAWGVRAMDYTVLAWDSPQLYAQVKTDFFSGMIISVCCTVCLLIASLVWFHGWEGGKNSEYGRLPDSLSDRKDIRGRYIVWIGHRCG